MKSVIAIGIIINSVSTETKWLCLEIALYTELGLAVWMSFVTRLYLVSKETGFQSLMFVVQYRHPEYDSKFIKSLWSLYWMQRPLNKVLKSFLERIQSLNCKVDQTSSILTHLLVSDSVVTRIFLES